MGDGEFVSVLREVVCDCGSTDVETEHDVGWDVGEGYEEKQHLDRCRACGATREWSEMLWYLQEPTVFCGKWERRG